MKHKRTKINFTKENSEEFSEEEMEQCLDSLIEMGYIEKFLDADGNDLYRLTESGMQIAMDIEEEEIDKDKLN
jgi:hypothetical protein